MHGRIWISRSLSASLLTAVLIGGSVNALYWLSAADRVYAQGWREIGAQDGSFTVQIPPGWHVPVATLRWFQAEGPYGEGVGLLWLDIFADAQSLQNAVAGCRQAGCDPGLQVWSPPLSPVGIVGQLYPRVVPSDFQNVRIMGTRNLAVPGLRAEGMVVHYARIKQNVPYESVDQIFSFPPVITPLIRYWNFVAVSATAPSQYFRGSLGVSARILQTLQYDPRITIAVARAPLAFVQELGQNGVP